MKRSEEEEWGRVSENTVNMTFRYNELVTLQVFQKRLLY